MQNFSQRPHFENRQIVQHGGESIDLSGHTTHVQGNYNTYFYNSYEDYLNGISGGTGYVNLISTSGNPSNPISGYTNQPITHPGVFQIRPPQGIFYSGNTNVISGYTTAIDVTGYVATSFDAYGTVIWSPPTTSSGSTPLSCDISANTITPCVSNTVSVNGNLTVVGNLLVSGATSASTTVIVTETVLVEDNNMELNYLGDHSTAIGGGVTVLYGISDTDTGYGTDSTLLTTSNGTWNVWPSLSVGSGLTTDYFSINIGQDNTTNSNYTFISGRDNDILGTSPYSSILGGNDNLIDGYSGTVILGGVGITATTDNTTYVPSLNIQSIGVGTPIFNLGLDSNGNVVSGITGGGSGSGAFTSTTVNNNIIPTISTGNTNGSKFSSILGGVSNDIGKSTHSTIAGGDTNSMYLSPRSFIGSGDRNTLYTSIYSVIGGGSGNTVNSSNYSIIGGGKNNEISDSTHSFIGNGLSNTINSTGDYNTIINGVSNNITSLVNQASIIGGNTNVIDNVSSRASIIGGENNNILEESPNSFIGGGNYNSIEPSTEASIIGGALNTIGKTFGGPGGSNVKRSTIVGGFYNAISATTSNHEDSSIIGGSSNLIDTSNKSGIFTSTNSIIRTSDNSTINGGENNIVNHDNSHIIGSNLTTDKINTTFVENLTVRGDYIVHSDTIPSTSLDSTDFKGSIIYFEHTGTTVSFIANNDVSGSSKCSVGQVGTSKSIELTYYNDDYIRTATLPTNGFNFYRNKGLLGLSQNTDGMIIKLDGSGNDSRLWFEENAESGMMIAGRGIFNGLSMGIAMNPDGTEIPRTHLQVGGTGTTGTFSYLPSNIPSSSGDTIGVVGEHSWDDNYYYIKTNTGWGRVLIDYTF